jgi:hypothetical protein
MSLNPFVDPRAVASTVQATAVSLQFELKALNKKVVNDPLCGDDGMRQVKNPFCTQPVDGLFDDYLRHSFSQPWRRFVFS